MSSNLSNHKSNMNWSEQQNAYTPLVSVAKELMPTLHVCVLQHLEFSLTESKLLSISMFVDAYVECVSLVWMINWTGNI